MAVKPALVDPTPVVNTARGIIFATYFKKNDLPVPKKKHLFSSNRLTILSCLDHQSAADVADYELEHRDFHPISK